MKCNKTVLRVYVISYSQGTNTDLCQLKAGTVIGKGTLGHNHSITILVRLVNIHTLVEQNNATWKW